MTNQEAIRRIKEHIAIHKYRESHAVHIVEALEMAIVALEKQDEKHFEEQLLDILSAVKVGKTVQNCPWAENETEAMTWQRQSEASK